MTTRYAPGDLCPDCGTPMEFEKGDESVGIPDGIVCDYCESTQINPTLHPVDWSRMPDLNVGTEP